MRILPKRSERQSGMTLVELLVYMVLLAIMGTLIVKLLMSVFNVHHEVSSTNLSSNDSQALLERVEVSVRNAAAIEVKDLGNGSQVLLTQVRSTNAAQTADDQYCTAFFYDKSAGTLKVIRRETNGAATIWASTMALSQWAGQDPQLTVSGITSNGASLFTLEGSSLKVDMRKTVREATEPVNYETAIKVLSLGGVKGKCF